MILPVVGYGSTILRKKTEPIHNINNKIKSLIQNMWETMYNAKGVGLAAPQINHSLQLFIVDSTQFFTSQDKEIENPFPDSPGIKQVFINPKILAKVGKEFNFEEGCLSIPNIRANVKRCSNVLIEYFDENMQYQKKEFYGITGRIILHEYDHIHGKLFIDYLSVIKKKTLSKKLSLLKKNHKKLIKYPMVFQ